MEPGTAGQGRKAATPRPLEARQRPRLGVTRIDTRVARCGIVAAAIEHARHRNSLRKPALGNGDPSTRPRHAPCCKGEARRFRGRRAPARLGCAALIWQAAAVESGFCCSKFPDTRLDISRTHDDTESHHHIAAASCRLRNLNRRQTDLGSRPRRSPVAGCGIGPKIGMRRARRGGASARPGPTPRARSQLNVSPTTAPAATSEAGRSI